MTGRCGSCRHFVRDSMLDGLYGGGIGICDLISDYNADLRNPEDMGTLGGGGAAHPPTADLV